ncbi:MAG: hypothetical protein KGL59_05905 [Acidobacteriota bacterium]|nr:hypothetical protein [Acidobacteriota bacterium]
MTAMDTCGPSALTHSSAALPWSKTSGCWRRSWLARSRTWSFLAFLAVAAAFVFARAENRYPAALVSALIFFQVQCFLPGCRPVERPPLCPWNWALFVFFLQLVLLPLSLLVFGPLPGVLPALPSAFAINLAILINVAAFVAFSGAYHFFWRRSQAVRERDRLRRATAGQPYHLSPQAKTLAERASPTLAYIGMNAAIGLAGLVFTFGNFAALRQYFSNPSRYLDRLPTVPAKFSVAAGLFLRPFLGFALILLWCRWLDRASDRRVKVWSGIVTLFAIPAVCLCDATFRYNRGAMVVPLVAMVAVILSGVRRFPRRTLAFSSAALLLVLSLMPFYGEFRSSDFTLRQLATDPRAREFLAGKIDLAEVFQVYAGAPQFLGFFLEQGGWGTRPGWGQVVLSSVLSPVPILGKPFRQSSGTAIYNRLIYGDSNVADQIAPFVGELFLDFHWAGVLAGFCLLGWAAHKLQSAFENARSSIEIFIWQYFAIWTFFLIFGSASVVSQVFVYFGWPLYCYLFMFRTQGLAPCKPAPGRASGLAFKMAGEVRR